MEATNMLRSTTSSVIFHKNNYYPQIPVNQQQITWSLLLIAFDAHNSHGKNTSAASEKAAMITCDLGEWLPTWITKRQQIKLTFHK